MFEGVSILREDYAADEQAMPAHNESLVARESGYIGVHTTKPQSLAFGLNDSPTGLPAWILEKRRTWSDCSRAVETKYSKDEILDTVMIYWVTQSIGTSLRYDYEAALNLWAPVREGTRLVDAPTAFVHMHGEILLSPRAWLERTFNLRRYTRLERRQTEISDSHEPEGHRAMGALAPPGKPRVRLDQTRP
jgi:hypothetical protein